MKPHARRALAALALLIAGAANAGTRQDATVLYSEEQDFRALQQDLGFNDAIVLRDGTIYLSGVVLILGEGETALEPAFERVYRAIGRTLERAGAGFDDIVDITSFHTDVVTQIPAMTAVQKRFIKAPYPAWTAIQVSRLAPGRGVAEIKIVAKLPAKPVR